jgi:hypothetical protein
MTIRDALSAKLLTLAAPALIVGVASSTVIGGGVALAADKSFPSAVVANGTLTVTGTNAGDTVHIGLGAIPNTFVVDFGDGDVRTFDPASFASISVFLGNGDDTFSVPAAGQFSDKRLSVFGDNGNDSILGSNGGDQIVGGNGDDIVDGGRGADTEFLDNGSDVAVWLPGEGSDVVDGGNGEDALNFVGADVAETMALTANGQHAVFTRQPGAVVMDTVAVETLNIDALGGADLITLNNMRGTALNNVNLDLSSSQGTGDNATDTVTVNGTEAADHFAVQATGNAVSVEGAQPRVHVTGAETTDVLQVNAGDGNDSVRVSDAARALTTIAVDLGADQF